MSGNLCDASSVTTPVIALRFKPFTEHTERFGPHGHFGDYNDGTISKSVYVHPGNETFDAYQWNLLATGRIYSRVAIRSSFVNALQPLEPSVT